MNELKKAVVSIDPRTTFIINAAFALIFIVFFLALPMFGSGWGAVSGARLLSHSHAGLVFVGLVLLMLPVGFMMYSFLKKDWKAMFVYILTYTYLICGLSVFGSLGIGWILNMIIVLIPWSIFSYFRNNLPCYIQ